MALEIRSFFVGIATVLGILSVGFGGGVMLGGIMGGDTKAPSKVASKVDRQAAKPPEIAPAEVKEIKPAVEPVAVKPPALIAPAPENVPTPAQAAAAPAPEPVATQSAPAAQPQPAPQSAPAPTLTAQIPPQPTFGAQRQVSLPLPFAESQGLSRREEARLRAQQRREERGLRREERRKLLAEWRQQEQLRREGMKASARMKPEAADDDDDNDDAPPRFVQPRGRFGLPPFRLFGN